MKNLLLILLLIPACIYCQQNPCENSVKVTLTLSAGIKYNLYSEVGVLGIGDRLGVYAGLTCFNREIKTGKADSVSMVLMPYARASFRTFETENTRQYFTAYIGKGMMGVSYRFAYILSPSDMLALEPHYDNLRGMGVNVSYVVSLSQ